MKLAAAILSLLLAASLAGCISDESEAPDDSDNRPVPGDDPTYESVQPANVKGLEFVAQLQMGDGAYPSGAGIWVFNNTVYGSSLGNGFFIADISDPTAPELLWNATTDAGDNNTVTSFGRDADLVVHPNGDLTLVIATQGDGMHLWDVTDPRNPVFASRVEVNPNHNVAVIPGTELVLNSQSGGLGRTNEIVDARQPYTAEVLGAFGTHGCHDITFFGSLGDEKFRAYCAGIQRTEIWDMSNFNLESDSFGIVVIAIIAGEDSPVVGNPAFSSYPVRTLHHLAMVNELGTVLIIGDEHNGGNQPGACYGNTDQGSTPFGALWFYDLSDEMDPALMGWISGPLVTPGTTPPDVGSLDPDTIESGLYENIPNCTAHFGDLVPGEEKLVMAWYSAGVLLIDFSDPANPFILDQYQPDPTNPWDAKIHGGYVFTGDIARGMDVLQLV